MVTEVGKLNTSAQVSGTSVDPQTRTWVTQWRIKDFPDGGGANPKVTKSKNQ